LKAGKDGRRGKTSTWSARLRRRKMLQGSLPKKGEEGNSKGGAREGVIPPSAFSLGEKSPSTWKRERL